MYRFSGFRPWRLNDLKSSEHARILNCLVGAAGLAAALAASPALAAELGAAEIGYLLTCRWPQARLRTRQRKLPN